MTRSNVYWITGFVIGVLLLAAGIVAEVFFVGFTGLGLMICAFIAVIAGIRLCAGPAGRRRPARRPPSPVRVSPCGASSGAACGPELHDH